MLQDLLRAAHRACKVQGECVSSRMQPWHWSCAASCRRWSAQCQLLACRQAAALAWVQRRPQPHTCYHLHCSRQPDLFHRRAPGPRASLLLGKQPPLLRQARPRPWRPTASRWRWSARCAARPPAACAACSRCRPRARLTRPARARPGRLRRGVLPAGERGADRRRRRETPRPTTRRARLVTWLPTLPRGTGMAQARAARPVSQRAVCAGWPHSPSAVCAPAAPVRPHAELPGLGCLPVAQRAALPHGPPGTQASSLVRAPAARQDPRAGRQVRAVMLDWADAGAADLPRFDVVLACDVLYEVRSSLG